jgi:hypothetical protein
MPRTLTKRQRQVTALAVECLKLPQVECPVRNLFFPGLYVREMSAPKDTFIIGHVHKTDHCFVLSKGKIQLWDEFAGQRIIEAPFTGLSIKGTQRMGRVLEDCIFSTFHPTKAKTTKAAVREIIEPFDPKQAARLQSSVAKKLLCH